MQVIGSLVRVQCVFMWVLWGRHAGVMVVKMRVNGGFMSQAAPHDAKSTNS